LKIKSGNNPRLGDPTSYEAKKSACDGAWYGKILAPVLIILLLFFSSTYYRVFNFKSDVGDGCSTLPLCF